jgi:hypothetical protein
MQDVRNNSERDEFVSAETWLSKGTESIFDNDDEGNRKSSDKQPFQQTSQKAGFLAAPIPTESETSCQEIRAKQWLMVSWQD